MNGHDEESGLVPRGLGDGAVAPFIDLTLSALGLLGDEPSVRQYAQADPDAHRAIRAVSAAVADAGIRVRDTAGHPGLAREDMGLFTADEFWTVDLAIDVIAMLAGGGGLDPSTRAVVVDFLRTLDADARGRHWKKQVRNAGDGPPEFRELRAHIPRRQLHPS